MRADYVAVYGPDGTGKSSIAARVAGSAPRHTTLVLHWRPGLLPRLGAFFRRPAPDGRQPHGARPHREVLSLIRASYYWLDQVLGYWLRIRPRCRAGTLVIMERGAWDMAVDPARYRVNLPRWLLELLARLVPSPDMTLVLTGDAQAIVNRKPELPAAEVERQIERWKELAQRHGWSMLDATRPLDDVVAAVTSQLATHGEVVDALDG